jgi:hypothetical protein
LTAGKLRANKGEAGQSASEVADLLDREAHTAEDTGEEVRLSDRVVLRHYQGTAFVCSHQ